MLKIDYAKYSNGIIFGERKFILNNGLTDILGNSHNARYTTQHSEAFTFNDDYYETEYNSLTLYRTITCSKSFVRIEL